MSNLRTLAVVATLSMSGLAQAQSAPLPEITRVAPPASVAALAEPHFIVTRIDARKCAHPLCGGYFVKAVNSTVTRCADGKLAKECHAVELDARALGWSDAQRATFEASFSQGKALVKGKLEPQPRGQFTAEVLRVTEAWQAQGAHKRPIGTFFSLKNNGVVCIQAPCPAFSLSTLNHNSAERTIDSPDFSPARASEQAVKAAWLALEKGPILAAGAVVRFPGFSPTGATVYGHKLLTSEFYLPARP